MAAVLWCIVTSFVIREQWLKGVMFTRTQLAVQSFYRMYMYIDDFPGFTPVPG